MVAPGGFFSQAAGTRGNGAEDITHRHRQLPGRDTTIGAQSTREGSLVGVVVVVHRAKVGPGVPGAENVDERQDSGDDGE